MTSLFDLVVIGAGPGGEVGAIRAAQCGLKVALIEKNEHLGGTCLNVGCIPTKALLESAKNWLKLNQFSSQGFSTGEVSYDWQKILAIKNEIVDAQRKGLKFLMKKNNITLIPGHGRFAGVGQLRITNKDGQVTEIQTKATLIATGSRVKDLPFAKINGSTIHSSDTILSISQVPKTMAIIGGGVVGMEFASLFAAFGTKIKVIEAAATIIPGEDQESTTELSRQLKKKFALEIATDTKLKSITDHKTHITLLTDKSEQEEKFDCVLISIGRAPVTDDLGLDKIALSTEQGFLQVDQHYQTRAKGVFAIGDVIRTAALAHTASAEAIHAVETIAGLKPPVIDYETNPSAVYTFPEIASIGRSEQTLKSQNIAYKIAKFPFAPMAKAKIEHATEGFIKILYHPEQGELLGVHIVGSKATELIAEFVLGKILETTIDEIGRAIHPHPTMSETIMEAAHAAHGAIHM